MLGRARGLWLCAAWASLACGGGAPPAEDPPSAGASRNDYLERGDLAAIRSHGTIRALVNTPDEALDGSQSDRELFEAFAARHGVKSRFVWVDDDAQLPAMLEAGQGDVILGEGWRSKGAPATIVTTRPLGGVSAPAPVRRARPHRAKGPITAPPPLAWAVRASATELLAELDRFLIEKALTKHADDRFTGDLSELKKRGVLRVLTENSPLTYYLHRGRRCGFDYELAAMVAKRLGVRLEMVVVPSREALVPWLLDGRGDMIAASFGVSEGRAKRVAFTTRYLPYDEVVVQASKGPKLDSIESLRGRKIGVRRGSSTAELLEQLRASHGPFEIVWLPEDESPSETIDRVVRGDVPFAVIGSHALAAERTMRSDAEAGPALPSEAPRGAAFAVRPTNPKLLQMLEAFVAKEYRGLEYNVLRRRYFEDGEVMARGRAATGADGRLSPYDELIRHWSREYGFDWRLMAAQAYQESRFDADARSWVGAIGLFQVMPRTGASLGFRQLRDPDQSTHAGILYMHQLVQTWDASIALKDRIRFALAAYNAGLGHVSDARQLARAQGLDPDRWFGNVEKAMLLLEQPRFHKRARNGYCRGREPVRYVSEIQSSYDDWIKLVPP